MAAKLYNHSTKQWEMVDDSEVDQRMQSGNYTFPTGLDIPVVSPDGQLGSISTDEAQTAWSEGFRWGTQADKDKVNAEKAAAIQQEKFDNDALAFGAGVLRGGTLGLSDVAMTGMGSLVGKGEEVQQALKATKDVNPLASTTGQIAGTVGATILSGGALGAAGTAAKAIDTGARTALAAQGVGKVGQAIGGLGAEGALWGLGEGISEATLSGNPDTAVDSIVSNIGLGALVGGTFGLGMSGVSAASPYFKKALDSSLSAVEGLSRGALNQTAKKIIAPVMRLQGKAEAADAFVDVINNRPLAESIASGSLDEFEQILKETKTLTKQVNTESTSLSSQIKNAVKTATKDEAQAIKGLITTADGDIRKALVNAQDDLTRWGAEYDVYRDTLKTNPPVYGQSLLKMIEKDAINMSKMGGQAKVVGQDILNRTKAYANNLSEGSEADLLYLVKRLTRPGNRVGIDGTAHKLAKDLHEVTNDFLVKHPNPGISRHWTEYNKTYAAKSQLEDVIKRTAKLDGGINNILFNPQVQQETAWMFNNLQSFVPELKAIQDAGKSISARRSALDAVTSKFKELNGQGVNPSTIDTFKEIVEDIVTSPSATKGMKRIEELQGALSGIETLNPLEATIRIYKVMGKNTDDLTKYVQLGQNWDKIRALKGATGPGDSLLDTAGLVVSGGSSLPVTVARKAANNPLSTIKAMGKIQDAIIAGNKRLNSALVSTGKKLVSKPVEAGVKSVVLQNESRKGREQRYQKAKKVLGDLANPQNMSQQLEQVGGGLQNASNLKLAIGLRLQTATQYLNESLPKDPLSGYSMMPQNSYWKPSDIEMSKFLRKMDAVNNPLNVVERVGDGTATRDEINAIQVVHPDVYKSLQQSITYAIMNSGDQIPYSRRVQLGTLFNIPTDYSMTPEFIASMQQPYVPADRGGRPEGSRTKNLDISPFDTVATETQKISYKDV